jgi:preprotein translocase SecE subunit
VNDYTKFGIGLAVVAVIFGILWRMGYLLRLTRYVQDTKEELKKCTWPTVDELKGSTAVVMITILLLGLFIVGVDFLITVVVNVLTNINKTA